MQEPTVDAHSIAASILAVEVRQRLRKYAPNDAHEMAVTLELSKIVRALRDDGLLKRQQEEETTDLRDLGNQDERLSGEDQPAIVERKPRSVGKSNASGGEKKFGEMQVRLLKAHSR